MLDFGQEQFLFFHAGLQVFLPDFLFVWMHHFWTWRRWSCYVVLLVNTVAENPPWEQCLWSWKGCYFVSAEGLIHLFFLVMWPAAEANCSVTYSLFPLILTCKVSKFLVHLQSELHALQLVIDKKAKPFPSLVCLSVLKIPYPSIAPVRGASYLVSLMPMRS